MKRLGWTVIIVLSMLGAVSASAVRADDFYKGKQVRLIVGTAAGQDYDAWGRLIGRHIVRHIPGQPTFITENMPGAGHIIATNYLFNVAAQDGTVIGMVTRNITDAALLNFPNVRFDPAKFNWIGSPEINHRAFFATPASGLNTADDLFTKEIIVGVTGAGQGVTTAPILLKNVLGMKIKIVSGYKAPQDIVLAMQKGEVGGLIDSIGGPNDSRAQWVTSGQMKVLVTMEEDPVDWLNVPTIFKYAKTEEQREILAFFAANLELGRPMLAPPNVPADRIDILRRAYDATMKDPVFLKEAESMGFEVNPQPGEKIESLVKSTMATPKEAVEKAEAMSKL
jgi:tripartite-type tricarboxylate transporter receptor subunit TctC